MRTGQPRDTPHSEHRREQVWMSVSIVDGTVTEAVKTRTEPFARYSMLTISRASGGTKQIKGPVAASVIAERLVAGAEGRFYLFKAIDHQGIHGIRLTDGTELYAYPGNNLRLFVMATVIAIAWIAISVVRDKLPLFAVLLLVVGTVGTVLSRKSKVETRQQFDADRR